METVGSRIASDFAVGDDIDGFFLYDRSSATHSISDPDQAWYDASRLSISIGDYRFQDPAPLAPANSIHVSCGADMDCVSMGADPDGDQVAGLAAENCRSQVHNPDALVFSNPSLPTALDMDDFDRTNISLS